MRRISDELYLRAKTILTRRRTQLERIALELSQKKPSIVARSICCSSSFIERSVGLEE